MVRGLHPLESVLVEAHFLHIRGHDAVVRVDERLIVAALLLFVSSEGRDGGDGDHRVGMLRSRRDFEVLSNSLSPNRHILVLFHTLSRSQTQN